MNRQKTNISAWYLLGLTALLLVGCLLLTIPAVFARYQEETTEDVKLRVRGQAKVHLWAGSNPEDDYFPGTGNWTNVNGDPELAFMVTNTDSTEDIPSATQEFRVRLIAGLGAWDGASEMKIRLTAVDGQQTEVFYAAANRILPNTPLYEDFGDGWYFTFLDEDEKELQWTLEGGKRSTISMQLALENAVILETSLLQLQLIGEMTEA